MLIVKLGLVFICWRYPVLAEVIATTTTTTTSLAETKLKLREIMNYPIIDNRHLPDFEDDYKYYQCENKGIKAFNGTPIFTPQTQAICNPTHDIQFNNYKHKCGIGNDGLMKSPWLVSVMIRNFTGNGSVLYRAAGTIIHPNLILVPQEPFEPFLDKKLMIRLNGQTQSLVIDSPGTQTRGVLKTHTENFTAIKYHPFRKSLLVLDEPILFNEYAQSICLPETDDQYEKQNCYVLGWKRTNKLVKLPADLIECKDFEELYSSVHKEFFVCTQRNVTTPFRREANYCREKQICDFSTVLVCPAVGQNNIYYQVGIGFMEAYDRGYFLSTIASKLWIDQTVFDLQFKSQYYTRNNDNNESQST